MAPNLTYKNSLAQAFSAAAKSYDRAAFVEQQIGLRLLERLDEIQIHPKRILDLGCGTGFFTQHLRARFPHASIINFDLAFEMVKFASLNLERKADQHYVCGDAEQLPFASKSFDLIFSNCCIMHMQNLNSLCLELKRVLTDKGSLLFTALGPDSLSELAMPAPWIDMHYYGDALLKAQFSNPVVDVEMLHFTYDSLHDLLQDLHETGAYQIDDYAEINNLNLPCSANFEIIYGIAHGNSQTEKQITDAQGNYLIPIESIITL